MSRRRLYLLYAITAFTAAMVFPLVVIAVKGAIFGLFSAAGDDKSPSRAVVEQKVYSYEQTVVDASRLIDPRYQIVFVESLNGGGALLVCEDTEDTPYTKGFGRVIAIAHDGGAVVSNFVMSRTAVDRIKISHFTYTAYDNGEILICAGRESYLFDAATLKIVKRFYFTGELDVNEVALSNDRQTLAVSAKTGLYIADYNMTSVKELISTTSDVSGVTTSYRYPHWSQDDGYIYYSIYADEYLKGIGRTTKNLGGSENFTVLEGLSAKPVMDDRIFYYASTSSQTSAQSSFRCGFYDPATKTMKDMIVSNAYYSNVRVSNYGSVIAAVGFNGRLQKISVIDPSTRKTIFSANYQRIIDYGFSPDERTFTILGVYNGEVAPSVRVVNISWNLVSR